MSRALFVTTLIGAAVGAAITAQAQPRGAIEEVIVTAQKREQSLQETPIAIAAFDAADIEQKGITDISGIGASVPNVKITNSPSNTTAATISIRGSVTINPAITWEPTVGIYVDGIFIGKNLGGVFDVADLERVEVLRGPQGTLYGKNTVGGAVNLITLKPSGEFGGKVTVGVGQYDLQNVYASVNLPALEMGGAGRLSTKVIASYRERDGLYNNEPDPFGNPLANPPSSEDLNTVDRKVARFDALWDVNEQFDIRYMYDYSDIDQIPPKQQLTNVDRSVQPGAFLPPGFEDYLTEPNDNRRTTSSDQSNFERSKSIAHTLIASYDIGSVGFFGDVTVRYLGNTRTLDWDDYIDIDGSPIDVFSSARYVSYDQSSHELQWVGSTERTNYVVGLYYFEEEADVFNPIDFFPFLYGDPVFGSFFFRNNNSYGFDNDAMAAFGQIDWRPRILDDRLTLTFGVRWTEEEKDSFISHPDGGPLAFSARDNDTYNNVSPTFIAAYNVTDTVNVYGKVSKGWKSGGFNGEAPSAEAFLGGYDPEEILSYELGMKSRWWDDRLQLNAAVFRNESKDMQMSIFVAGNAAASTVENAGEATVQGFELEVVAIPIDDLRLTLNYGYLDAEYGEFMDFIPGTTIRRDFKDEKDFPYTPRHTGSASAEYTFLRQAWGELVGYVDYEFVDEHVPYINPEQNATSKINTYQLVNGRISLQNMPVGEDRSLRLSLWGKNLLDKEYRINTIPFGAWTSSFYGDPRTYGVDLTFTF